MSEKMHEDVNLKLVVELNYLIELTFIAGKIVTLHVFTNSTFLHL